MSTRLGSVLEAATKLVRELIGVARHAEPRDALHYGLATMRALPQIVRSRSLAPADRSMADRLVALPRSSLRWPGRNFGLIRELAIRKVYQALPGFEVQAGEMVVDLGANCGLFTCLATMRGARVLAVEAQRAFIDEIVANASLNGVGDRVTPVWAMVGAETGLLSSPDARARASHMAMLEPPIRSIDEIIEAHAIEAIDLLKVDIEGSEFSVFVGEPRWLGRVRRIVAEAHAEYGDVLGLAAYLNDRGFDVTRLGHDLRPDPPPSAPSQLLFARARHQASP